MIFNRKRMTLGLVGLGLVGTLTVGGVVAAQAATGRDTTPQPSPTNSQGVDSPEFGHMAGRGFGQNSPMTVVADYLGLSRTALQDQLQSGQSLANAAAAQGKSVSGLEDAMIAALKSNLDANSTLNPDQQVAAVEQMKSRIDVMVNVTGTEMGVGMDMGISDRMGMHSGAGSHENSGMGFGIAVTTR